jgi:hypothetical protein
MPEVDESGLYCMIIRPTNVVVLQSEAGGMEAELLTTGNWT